MKKEIYVLNKKMSKETFDAVMSKFPDNGPTPKNINEVLFKMMKDGHIHIWLDPSDKEDPIHLGQKLPNAESIKVIFNP